MPRLRLGTKHNSFQNEHTMVRNELVLPPFDLTDIVLMRPQKIITHSMYTSCISSCIYILRVCQTITTTQKRLSKFCSLKHPFTSR